MTHSILQCTMTRDKAEQNNAIDSALVSICCTVVPVMTHNYK